MPKRLLLVDDNENQHELFRCYTTTADDFELGHASDIQQAAEEIKSDAPDVVFLDNRLHPHEDFRETVPLIREAGFEGKIVLISSDVDHPVFHLAGDFSVHSCINEFEFTLGNFREKLSELSASSC